MALDAAETERLEEERRLIERAQAGQRDALRPLFERHAEPLYGAVILPRIGNPTAAEDILRDTFLTAIEKIGTFEWQGRSVFAWLRQIAVNKVIDAHRRSHRAGRMLALLAGEAPRETAREDDADEALIAREERQRNAERVARALEALLPRYRQVIELRLIDELAREECAARLGVTVGHLDVLFFRAIRALRKRFEETA